MNNSQVDLDMEDIFSQKNNAYLRKRMADLNDRINGRLLRRTDTQSDEPPTKRINLDDDGAETAGNLIISSDDEDDTLPDLLESSADEQTQASTSGVGRSKDPRKPTITSLVKPTQAAVMKFDLTAYRKAKVSLFILACNFLNPLILTIQLFILPTYIQLLSR